MNYIDKWQLRFLSRAIEIGKWSKDPSRKVGCVITNDENIELASGYNGFPRGVDDSPERYNDRLGKLARVVHAEANAIVSAARVGHGLLGSTCHTSMFPCSNCAGLIIQAGIKTVVYLENKLYEEKWGESVEVSYEMLREAGLRLHRIPQGTQL